MQSWEPTPRQLALFDAVHAEDTDTIVKLLRSGTNVNYVVKGSRGGRPIQVALARGNSENVRILLEAKADISGLVPHALNTAVRGGLDNVKLVMATGVEWNKCNGYTPLHEAAEVGSVPIAEYLLECKASINATTSMMATPLEVAKGFGNCDMVRLLILRGASLTYSPTAPVTRHLLYKRPVQRKMEHTIVQALHERFYSVKMAVMLPVHRARTFLAHQVATVDPGASKHAAADAKVPELLPEDKRCVLTAFGLDPLYDPRVVSEIFCFVDGRDTVAGVPTWQSTAAALLPS